MTPPPERPSDDSRTGDLPRRSTWRERIFVLGGLALAATLTAAAPALGLEDHTVGLAWAAALAWTVLASLACALRAGISDGDWSAFTHRRRRDSRTESFDWDTRTGVWAWMRVAERRARLLDAGRFRDRCTRSRSGRP